MQILLISILFFNLFYAQAETKINKKYLFYDINPSEGFNLRRDVYIRIANLISSLNKQTNTQWKLVLPPWTHLPHWKNEFNQTDEFNYEWSQFFDVNSLNHYIPVIELRQYIHNHSNSWKIDVVYYLQNYKQTLSDAEFKWIDKADIEPCHLISFYDKDSGGKFRGPFWSFDSFFADEMYCVSFQGTTNLMANLFLKENKSKRIMIDRAEVLLHEHYGQLEYWKARRSMRFAKHLIRKANEIRLILNSTDQTDNIKIEPDWRNTTNKKRLALGGPYLGVHLRRGDFLRIRQSNVISIDNVAKQIRHLLVKLDLKQVYLATDSSLEEIKELENKLLEFKLVYFKPSFEEIKLYKDGGIAIIDQLVCAHSKYFIGTYESTFSYRIQEEREILGFEWIKTFNRFCFEKNENNCASNKWLIKYE